MDAANDLALLKPEGRFEALPENVNYAVKSSLLLSFLESVPEVIARLKEPNTRDRKFEGLAMITITRLASSDATYPFGVRCGVRPEADRRGRVCSPISKQSLRRSART